MTDVGATIAPKSDQLNSDDLIQGPMTIKITKVAGNEGTPEQPINIFFEGDNGKPYRPCKSMRRVLVTIWGRDGADYAGRSMTLYRDPEVMFGGMKVGGTRISHMSDMAKEITMALTATRANRKPFTVKPLKVEKPAPTNHVDLSIPELVPVPNDGESPIWSQWLKTMGARIDAMQSAKDLEAFRKANEAPIASLRAASAKQADALATRFEDRGASFGERGE